jgi:hypothetical protein
MSTPALDLAAGVLLAASWMSLRLSVGAGFRPQPALLLDAALALWCGLVALMLGGRPLLAALVVAFGAAGLVLTDRVKRASLREPVVFADRAELVELRRHPKLYLPFAGTLMVVSGAAALLALVVLLVWLEPPLPLSPAGRALVLAALAAIYCALAAPPLRRALSAAFRRWRPCLDPAADMRRFGMLATFVIHATLARAARAGLQAHHVPRLLPWRRAPVRPIVLVQSESFFDVARLDPALAQTTVPHYAALLAGSVQHGRLDVPCWGANTVRTEFAVLTGIDPTSLGADRFNPYERFARAPVSSIAWRLRAAGYRTICVHPFDTSFYGRRTVLPNLGFAAIVGPEAFAPAAPGQYVSDLAVADYVRGLLERHGKRLFVFVVTMQAHGPWTGLDPTAPPLQGYLAALRDADTALPVLRAAVGAHNGVLAIYGDHQPSLSALAACGITDSDTDYLIWDSQPGDAARRDLRADQLGAALCEIAVQTPCARLLREAA